jgi:hypothetical protein
LPSYKWVIEALIRASEHPNEGPRRGARPWIIAAVALALALAVAMLVRKGGDRAGVEAAILWTGRLAFAFFWPSYVGGALTTLFGRPFQGLKALGRSLGLGFAAVIGVHLSLVAWLCWMGHPPPVLTFLVFGIAAAWVFALAACSMEQVSRWVGPAGWWVLRNIGMNYIAFVFAFDFVRIDPTFTPLKAAEYFPLAALSVLGPTLRLLAWLTRLLRAGAGDGPVAPRDWVAR